MLKRSFPIEQGFKLVVLFLISFWLESLKAEMVLRGMIFPEEATPKEREELSEESKEKDDLHFFNMIVFGSHLIVIPS